MASALELFPPDRQASLKAQVACVEREVRMREKVYPRWVRDAKMTHEDAYREIATMRAVLKTLQGLR